LWLRKLRPDDAADLFAYASDPAVAQYVTWEPHKSIEDSKTFLDFVVQAQQNGEVTGWGMELKAEHKLVGTCGFVSWNIRHGRAELGYALGRDYWGQGLMSEAVQAVLAFGFETMQLHRIEALCEVPNIGSARVMEKCNMRYEGTLRGRFYVKGSHRDLKIYSILRDEWTRQ
jgi:ribosomal-protein-alanine N-acetyltransferase